MPDQNQPHYQAHGIDTPHIAVNDSDGVIGLGIGDRTIVQLRIPGPYHTNRDDIDEDELRRVDGTLPEELITNVPHVTQPPQTTTDDTTLHYIPLPPAPEWYRTRVENEFNDEDWCVYADQYYRRSDAGEMEAVVMALTEMIDTIGAGQSAVISDVTSWPEELVEDIMSELRLPKQDRYRRQSMETIQVPHDDTTTRDGTS